MGVCPPKLAFCCVTSKVFSSKLESDLKLVLKLVDLVRLGSDGVVGSAGIFFGLSDNTSSTIFCLSFPEMNVNIFTFLNDNCTFIFA
jgi:hypothetical protein